MFVVHATERLRAKLGPQPPANPDQNAASDLTSAPSLGPWYATLLRWRTPVVLLVAEQTLLPVLVPLSPARSLFQRFPAALAQVLLDLETPDWFVEAELAQMRTHEVARTTNRSTVGMLTEFSFLADAHRTGPGTPDLIALALSLARTPCGPLRATHHFPDRAVAHHVARSSAPGDPPHDAVGDRR